MADKRKAKKRAKKLAAGKKLEKKQTLTDFSIIKTTDASSPKLF